MAGSNPHPECPSGGWMTTLDPQRIIRLRGLLDDLVHATGHGIGLIVVSGTFRFLASTLERMFENRDAELPGPTQLALNVYGLFVTWWWLLPLALIADFGVLRVLRRRDPHHRTAAGYSLAVMLGLVLIAGLSTIVLVHPWATALKTK
jgi:type II secretory pathway component PulF